MIKRYYLYILFLQLVLLSCKNKQMIDTKVYDYNLFSLDSVGYEKYVYDEFVSGSNSFEYVKFTQDGCVSFYNNNNELVKVCKDTFYRYKIKDSDMFFPLDNYTWIDSIRVLFVFNIIYSQGFHDESIFVYNTETRQKEITYNFIGSGLSHSKLTLDDPPFYGGKFFENYTNINSSNFDPIFIKEDSSLILPIKNSFLDTMTSSEKLAIRNNRNMLIRLYNDNSTKRSEVFPIKFHEILPDGMDSQYVTYNQNEIVGKRLSENKLLISNSFSNKYMLYDFDKDEKKTIYYKDFFEQPIGYKRTYEAIRASSFDTSKRDFFYNLFNDVKTGGYFREVRLGITPITQSKYIQNKTIIQVLDSNFNLLGFASGLPGKLFLGSNLDGNLLFLNREDYRNNRLSMHIYSLNKDFKSVKDTVLVKKAPKPTPFLLQADVSAYVNEMIPRNTTYDEFMIVPFNYMCATCVEALTCYFSKIKEVRSKTAIIILPGYVEGLNEKFGHLPNVYLDTSGHHLAHFKSEPYIPLYKFNGTKMEQIKVFESTWPERIAEYLNPNVTFYDLDCVDIDD